MGLWRFGVWGELCSRLFLWILGLLVAVLRHADLGSGLLWNCVLCHAIAGDRLLRNTDLLDAAESDSSELEPGHTIDRCTTCGWPLQVRVRPITRLLRLRIRLQLQFRLHPDLQWGLWQLLQPVCDLGRDTGGVWDIRADTDTGGQLDSWFKENQRTTGR